MLQLQGEDGTKHHLQRGKSLLVSAFLSGKLYDKALSCPPQAEQALPWAGAQGSVALARAGISPFPMAAWLHEHPFISVWANSCQTPGNLKADLKTE